MKLRRFSRQSLSLAVGFGVLVLMYVAAGSASRTGLHAAPASPQTAAASQQPPASPFLNQYCVGCHNDRLRTAGLSLAGLNEQHVTDDPAVWEKVVLKLRTGAMPPPTTPNRPDRAAAKSFLDRITTTIDRAAVDRPNPGRVTLHRLNRTEYANAVRDLLGVEVDGRALLPQDDSDLGFDNMADILSVSPALLDRYIFAARKISRMTLGIDANVGETTYTIPQFLFQDDRLSEDLPFGARGGIVIEHQFPFDGEYQIKIRLARQLYEFIRGLDEPQQLDVRLDGRRIEVYGIGGEAPGQPAPWTWAGELRADIEWENYLLKADEGLEARFATTAGAHKVSVSFIQRPFEIELEAQPSDGRRRFSIDTHTASSSGKPEAAVYSVTIGGVDARNRTEARPQPTKSSALKLRACDPVNAADEEACAKRTVAKLARHAFRRPVSDDDVAALMPHYRGGRRDGSFWAGIGRVIEYILVDPQFLFRFEAGPPNVKADETYPLADVALASRLSFFLWSSIPDDELLTLAEQKKLRAPSVLDQQVKRMLRDPRSAAFVDNFFGQWLAQRDLAHKVPVPEFFPDFDENLRDAFARETKLFVESQFADDRSIFEMITADYTFLNERLARHYRVPNVYGSRFRRVKLPDNTRGGILGQGSILTVTSYAHRTSPVIRGKWLLDNLLGAPPPPPPADVPALPDTAEQGKSASVRARLEQHRKNAACASCHARMDPLGFALEKFDAIGAPRTEDGGQAIDASGALPDGTRVDGLQGLKRLLATDRREDFSMTVAQKVLIYALGRGLDYPDMPAVRKIVRDAGADNYSWSSIILSVVKSVPFQFRRSES